MPRIMVINKSSIFVFFIIITCDQCFGEVQSDKQNQPGGQFFDGRALQVPLSAEAGQQLHDHWTSQAVSAFMAAYASTRLDQLPGVSKEQFSSCSQKASSVTAHATCVMQMIGELRKNQKTESTTSFSTAKMPELPKNPLSTIQKLATNATETTKSRSDYNFKLADQVGKRKLDRINKKHRPKKIKLKTAKKKPKRRFKREILQANSYSIPDHRANKTPFGMVAKLLKRTVLDIKRKQNKTGSWQSTLHELREKARQIKEKKQLQEAWEKRLKQFAINTNQTVETTTTMEMRKPKTDLTNDTKAFAHKIRKALNLLRDGFKLGMMASGQNISNFDNKTLKMISPRILSVLPEDGDDDLINLLSPSLFSLHGEGRSIEALTSLPNIFKLLKNEDQEEWMELIMEAAGVTDAVAELSSRVDNSEQVNSTAKRGTNGQPLYFTKKNVTDMFGEYEERKIDTFEALYRSFNLDQIRDLNSTGYTVMRPEQIEFFYGSRSPYNNSRAHRNLITVTQGKFIHPAIERDIERFAMEESNRSKRAIILSPLVQTNLTLQPGLLSQAIILSPAVLSPVVLSPAVLGPFILSPWMFIPVIIAPRVLSPLILNPLIFSPIVLSPLVLHPLILSPGVFNPLVLSPLVLSPLILSPQVATPLILSPMVLNPLILNPMVMSPLVLSPFVLSPLVLSPQALFALVLSPYALSPLVESKLIASEIVLSPSFLS